MIEIGLVWMLWVDGEPAGSREVRVSYQGESGDRVRVFEAYTEMYDPRRSKRKEPDITFRQRLTANSHEGSPASFHASLDADGVGSEVQARWASGMWKLAVTDKAGTTSSSIHPNKVDMSTVDIFDPESDHGIAGREWARVLDTETGQIIEGPVLPLGNSEMDVGGEPLWVDGWEWRTPAGPWRLWYALNGFVVRFEAPIGGQRVDAKLVGGAPRGIDEFGVPPQPRIEEMDIP